MTRAADKIKLDRKALAGPDEFHTVTGRLTTWAAQNRTLVVSAAGGAVLAGTVVLSVIWYSGQRADAAAIRFRAAHTEFEAGSYQAAAQSFAGLHDDYGRTPFGRLATLYQAHALARSGDAAGAATRYGEYLAGSPATPYLRQAALTGMARAHQTLGAAPEALQAYEQAASIDGPLALEARLGLAAVRESTGDARAAEAAYLEILADGSIQLDPELRRFVEGRVSAEAREAAADTGDAP